jgi:hypothetical protein
MGWIGLGFREDDGQAADDCNGGSVASPSQTSMTQFNTIELRFFQQILFLKKGT